MSKTVAKRSHKLQQVKPWVMMRWRKQKKFNIIGNPNPLCFKDLTVRGTKFYSPTSENILLVKTLPPIKKLTFHFISYFYTYFLPSSLNFFSRDSIAFILITFVTGRDSSSERFEISQDWFSSERRYGGLNAG